MTADTRDSQELLPAETTQQAIPEPVRRRAAFEDGTIALVANSIQLSDNVTLPFELGPGITFDRASANEISRFKEVFPSVLGSSAMMSVFDSYEHSRKIEEIDGGGTRLLLEELPQDQWRYYVVRFDDNGGKNFDLTQVSLVTHAFLDIGSICLHASAGHGWDPYALVNLYSVMEMKETITVSTENLRELGEVISLYTSLTSRVREGGNR